MSGLETTQPGTGRAGAPRIGAGLLRLALALALIYAALGAGLTYWQVAQAQSLTEDPRNPLVLAAARNAPRGRILDARGVVLASNRRTADGTPIRRYSYPVMTPVLGYKSLIFGTSGLEQAYDAELVGLGQLSPADRLLRKFRRDPYDPQDLHLSIDVRLQARAVQLLGRERGAVVAIEPSTGRVLAMASAPTFDANRVVDLDGGGTYFEALRRQPPERSALLNRATQGRYTPGSTFKIVTAIAALGSGAITPETVFEDQPEQEDDGFLVQGFRVRDGHHRQTGDTPLSLVPATEASCNIYFAHAGLETGGRALVDWARRLGFGRPIPFDLPTAPSQVTGGRGRDPGGFKDKVELANASYGQAETFVTPLQMALVATTIANGGQLMKPKLVDKVVSESGQERALPAEGLRRVLGPDDAGVIRQAMQQAVEGDVGRTVVGGRAKIPGISTAGKTGTAELGGRSEPHSWFIGFAPVESPRIAIAVVVERAGFGRERAAPMAGSLMGYYLRTIAPGTP